MKSSKSSSKRSQAPSVDLRTPGQVAYEASNPWVLDPVHDGIFAWGLQQPSLQASWEKSAAEQAARDLNADEGPGHFVMPENTSVPAADVSPEKDARVKSMISRGVLGPL